MKIFFSESQPDYSTYTFNYAIYCLMEDTTELPVIYAKGFLPYTGNPALKREVFYLARSLRVELNRFADTSENRRVNRKVEPLNIKVECFPKSEFDFQNQDFLDFCTNYAADRFHDGNMSKERLMYVLNRQCGSHIFQFTSEGKILGYVWAGLFANSLQYWYAFFDTDYLQSHSLGKWMMWRTIQWAKANDLEYVYLGTCYGHHAMYKVRDHKGLAFFDGNSWNQDMKLLKRLCKTDGDGHGMDAFKRLEIQEYFLDKL